MTLAERVSAVRARPAWASRPVERSLLVLVSLLACLGFVLVTAAARVRSGADPRPALAAALLPAAVLVVSLAVLHVLLMRRGSEAEQFVLPIAGLLAAVGLIMLWRLRPPEVLWLQLTRGWLPGVVAIAVLVLRVDLVERVRREWPLLISLAGLALLVVTAFFGAPDESGARLSLKLGPLPAVQTSELIKLALIIFLAWYIEAEGEAAEGRAHVWGWLRLPAVRYLFPGLLYVSLATLALVRMSDFGAIIILGVLFVTMLYAGFEPRLFWPVAGIGLALSLAVGLLLARTWHVPDVMQQRWLAFLNPWSRAPLVLNGQPTGITIAEGPGYQIQQSIYALLAGGASGTGLGFGSPNNVPLAHSDMIFAAIGEELGALVALALLALYGILLLRLLRLALCLPRTLVFERLLLVGIAAHLFVQTFVMVGGTLDLLPLTGITVPFLSQGGIALLVNLVEIGIALALAQRLEVPAG